MQLHAVTFISCRGQLSVWRIAKQHRAAATAATVEGVVAAAGNQQHLVRVTAATAVAVTAAATSQHFFNSRGSGTDDNDT